MTTHQNDVTTAFDKDQAQVFIRTLFHGLGKADIGEIELRSFRQGKGPQTAFYVNLENLLDAVEDAVREERDVYVGVNPRTGKGGRKENVAFVVAFHAEIDYGTEGHRKDPTHRTEEDALGAIESCPLVPTMVVCSGGGFHCYWILNEPVPVKKYGIEILEGINKRLSESLGGDKGTHDISRIFRLPGTWNLKNPGHPRAVTIHSACESFYTIDEIRDGLVEDECSAEREQSSPVQGSNVSEGESNDPWLPDDIARLPISERIQRMILTGNGQEYQSRSEADQAVITALVQAGIEEEEILAIFKRYAIGDKYREHSNSRLYLQHNIKSARKYLRKSGNSGNIRGSGFIESDKGRRKLNLVQFQEEVVRKYQLVLHPTENLFYQYTGQCYEPLSSSEINRLCQETLGEDRNLFTRKALQDFEHFAEGDNKIRMPGSEAHLVRYLPLQNGLFDLESQSLVPHTAQIFTVNPLPYSYDPQATCARFERYLHEVFEGDRDRIQFIQQAMGYIFHKALPTPALFFLIGKGANGKSVFLDLLRKLAGEENSLSLSLSQLNDERLVPYLQGKMLNTAYENPQNRRINMEQIKAVCSGDSITGRAIYQNPQQFRPYCKHFFALNQVPEIQDQTHGMWRRVYVVEFSRVFGPEEQDPYLRETLYQELPGIFNFALKGFDLLQKNKFHFPDSLSLQQAKGRFRHETSSAVAFACHALQTVEDPKSRIRLTVAHERYLHYCHDEGIPFPETIRAFKKVLEQQFCSVNHSSAHKNQVCLFGVKWRSDWE